MPSKGRPRGRPRLTPEAYQARLEAYCARYEATAAASGLPPFPAGRRETPQHREWLSLYKAHQRLTRREQARCERCAAPAAPGSVLCEAHRSGSATSAEGGHRAATPERRRLLKAQGGRCTICSRSLALADAVDYSRRDDPRLSVLHRQCAQLLGSAELAGREALERVMAYLWPAASGPRHRRPRPGR